MKHRQRPPSPSALPLCESPKLCSLMGRSKKAKQKNSRSRATTAQHAASTNVHSQVLSFMAAADQAMLRGDTHGALDHLLAAYECAPQLEALERKISEVLAAINRLETPPPPPPPSTPALGPTPSLKELQRKRRSRGGGGGQGSRHSKEVCSSSSRGHIADALRATVAQLLSDVAKLAVRFLHAFAPVLFALFLVLFALWAYWKALRGNIVGALVLWALSYVDTRAVADKLGVEWIFLPLTLCKLSFPLWWLLLQSRVWAFTCSLLALLAHYHVGFEAQYVIIVPSVFMRVFFALLPALWAMLAIVVCVIGFIRLLAKIPIEDTDGGGTWKGTFSTMNRRETLVDVDEHGHGLSTAIPQGASDAEVKRILGCATWHAALQVEINAPADVLRKAHIRKVLATHPDKCKDAHAARAFRRVMSALSVLSDANKRQIYEAGLRSQGVL